MKELSQATVCCVDHGLFLPVAQTLAKSFKRVLYHTPDSIEGFPTINKCLIGDGFEGVERCDDIWKVKHEVDAWVFPDIQHSGLQLELESQGFPVWGSRAADEIETNRELFHKTLKKLGLDCPKYRVVKGLTNLRLFLADNEGPFFIKISKYRGSLETTKFRSWERDEGLLDVWAVRFGPAKEHIPFLVFDPIDTPLEIGGDTYCIDGQFPELMVHGEEWKDRAYLGTITTRTEMPDDIQKVLDAFGPVLEGYRYRNAWSMELRKTDDAAFFIDPCCRWSQPATASRLELFSNIADIIYYGAHGQLIEPEPAAAFAAECVLTTKVEKGAWRAVEVPKELAGCIRLNDCCEIDGMVCFPPDDSRGESIGWLVAIGDTIEDTIEIMKTYADNLPDGMEADTDALVDLLAELKTAEEAGVEFSEDPIPEPETALNV